MMGYEWKGKEGHFGDRLNTHHTQINTSEYFQQKAQSNQNDDDITKLI